MSRRNRGSLRTTAGCVISLLAGDLPHLDLPVHHLKAETRAAQRMQLGQRRLQGGKGSGVPARVTPWDSAGKAVRRCLLPAGHRQREIQRRCGQSKRDARSPQCEISSTAAFSCLTNGTLGCKCRSARGPKSQFQGERGAKNTSKSGTMRRQIRVSAVRVSAADRFIANSCETPGEMWASSSSVGQVLMAKL